VLTIRSGSRDRQTRLAWLAAVAGLAAAAGQPATAPKKLLVVTVTKGYRHASIPVAERLIERLGQESGAYAVDFARTDEDLGTKMTASALAGYDGVVFASTTGDLPLPDREAFLRWLADGHGFVGIHAATDTFHGWLAYLDMIGGEFKTHGPQVKVSVRVDDKGHPATKGLASPFEVFDEIYEFQRFDRSRVHTLLALDRHPQQGTPGFYPLAWTRKHGKGRVFYTALGHREDVLEAPWFGKHLLGGILWAVRTRSGPSRLK
jgi:type 1 glutamine amidotransferase